MVAERNSTRPTREQVLFGLRECFAHLQKNEKPLDSDTDFVALITEDGFDDDALEFEGLFPIHHYFGSILSNVAWRQLFRLDQNKRPQPVNFSQLADFIAEQLNIAVSFEPETIFGRACRPAGVFMGLEELAKHVQPDVERFAPSTPIRERINGNALLQYFGLLNWLTEGKAPAARDPLALTSFGRQCSDYATLFIGIASHFVLILWALPLIPKGSDWAGWMIGVAGVAFFTWIVVVYLAGHWLVQRCVNPLPPGIETFRDLAKLIANRMEANGTDVSHATQVAR